MKTGYKNYFFELFYALTGAIVIFSSLEILAPGLVVAYFNLNYLLLFWLIIGIILIQT